jgi:hypothetical protein
MGIVFQRTEVNIGNGVYLDFLIANLMHNEIKVIPHSRQPLSDKIKTAHDWREPNIPSQSCAE